MDSIDQVKVIILDFDGVIVESVGIKDRAFQQLYQGYPDHIDEIMDYHLAHNATIRFEKFQHIAENILHLPYTEADKDRLSQEFAERVYQQIVACPYVKGAESFLAHFHGRLPLYLVSMSPETELLRILEQRNLVRFFTHIFSANWKKKDAIEQILQKENVTANDAVFIGDSYEDYQASQMTRVRFIGRNSGKSFKDAPIPLKEDMDEVRLMLSGAVDG